MLSPVVLLGQASDPSTFELIQKIHTLQKRLISKTEEVVEKELLLQVPVSCPGLPKQAQQSPGSLELVICSVASLVLNCRWQQ